MSRSDVNRLSLLALGLVLVGVGCGEEGDPPINHEPVGAARFVIVVPELSTLLDDVDHMTVSASTPDGSVGSVPLSESKGQWSGRLGLLRKGEGYSFALDAGNAAGSLQIQAKASNVTITPSRTALVLLPAWDSVAESKGWPVIDALVASSDAIEAGGEISLRVEAHDTDSSGALTYAWTATDGTFDAPNSALAVWTAPRTAGAHMLKLTATDASGDEMSLEFTLHVQERGMQSPEVHAVIREPPISLVVTPPSVTSVGPAEPLLLKIDTKNSRGALSFSWAPTAGIVSVPENVDSQSEVVWMSLSCLPPDVTPGVTVTAKDGRGSSKSHTFPITWTGPVCTRPLCAFSARAFGEEKRIMQDAECTTDTTLFIPDTYTFDGQGHALTAVDPPGKPFTGAVLRNRGETARVQGVTVSTSGLKDACSAGPAMLRGILLDGASGEIVDSKVVDISKGSKSGCQEGYGIEVRNDDASRGPFRVEVRNNQILGYQKVGILATGAVDVTITANTVEGGGPVDHVARNGIQINNGAKARVTQNKVSGNAYSGPQYASSTGLLVAAGKDGKLVPELVVEDNTFTDNDIGVYLSQNPGDPPEVSARARIVNNVFQNDALSNQSYQAAITDYYQDGTCGTGSVITSNEILGMGYDPDTDVGRTFGVDVYTPEPASKLVFLSGPHDISAGSCSGKVVVQSQDQFGNLVRFTEPFSLKAEGDAGVTFYSDPGCSDASAISTVEVSKRSGEAVFYFRSSVPGTATVSVSAGSLTPAAQEQIFH